MTSSIKDWSSYLIAAGGAVGVLGVLYFLLREGEEEGETNASSSSSSSVKSGSKLSKEGGTVRQLLTEMIHVEEMAKQTVQDIVKEELSNGGMTLEQAYDRVEAAKLVDPLEKYGLSVEDFEQLIGEFQNDSFVMQAMAKLAGAFPSAAPTVQVDVAKIVEVKSFMADELKALLDAFSALPDLEQRSSKSAGIALQALVSAKAERKFGIKTDDVDAAIPANQELLAANGEFIDAYMRTHQQMTKLMTITGQSSTMNRLGGDLD